MREEVAFSVTQLTSAIKSCLEPRFRDILVQGEISNFKQQSSGHLYFSLKDNSSQISAVLFKGNTYKLSRLPKEGDKVVIRGELSIYSPRGSYQIVVRELNFLGIGELLLKLHALKEELKGRGWFDQSLKKQLPKLPKTIGVVTSPTGAVIQDIINVLSRRFKGFHLILNPVKVQGEGAAEEIAKAIVDFNNFKLADILIVGRGGGSLEDLWAFNEEIVAKAIFESKIPIISAVGHETDTSIADLVADIRAPTPSAAAEIAIGEKLQLIKTLQSLKVQCYTAVSSSAKKRKEILQTIIKNPLLSSPYTILGKSLQLFDELKNGIDSTYKFFIDKHHYKVDSLYKQINALKPSTQLLLQKKRLFDFKLRVRDSFYAKLLLKKKLFNAPLLQDQLKTILKREIKTKRDRLEKLAAHLNSLDPKEILKKGYTILFSEKEKSIILSIDNLQVNQKFYALMSDGQIAAKVEEIKPCLKKK